MSCSDTNTSVSPEPTLESTVAALEPVGALLSLVHLTAPVYRDVCGLVERMRCDSAINGRRISEITYADLSRRRFADAVEIHGRADGGTIINRQRRHGIAKHENFYC